MSILQARSFHFHIVDSSVCTSPKSLAVDKSISSSALILVLLLWSPCIPKGQQEEVAGSRVRSAGSVVVQPARRPEGRLLSFRSPAQGTATFSVSGKASAVIFVGE